MNEKLKRPSRHESTDEKSITSGLIKRFLGKSLRQSLAGADRPSLVGLVAANLLPLAFALFFHWEIGGVVMFYWWENIIIGLYAILRIVFAQGSMLDLVKRVAGRQIGEQLEQADAGRSKKNLSSLQTHGQKFFLVPFFCFHYFFFCFVHGIFLLVLLSGDTMFGTPFEGSPLDEFWQALPAGGFLAVSALAASHGVSFVRNYLWGGEYENTAPVEEMFRPYFRIVLLHVCILIGGIITFWLGSPLLMVVLFIIAKTALDAMIHSASHWSEDRS